MGRVSCGGRGAAAVECGRRFAAGSRPLPSGGKRGLYVVEPDGRPSWSYHPAPPGQQVRAMEDDIIYDGAAAPGGHFVFSTHRYIREIDREKHTVWEYRVSTPVEVKSGVRLAERLI